LARVFTIPPEKPFLASLAEGLIARHGERLADALILLPSRRACLGLRDAFLEVTGGRPMLLPRLQPVGEAELDEPLLNPDPADEPPPAIDPVRRRLLLARLVLAKGGVTDEQAMRLAGELARFLDEMQTEEVPLDRLHGLVPDDYAEHWQEILAFLDILVEAWPAILEAEGRIDPAARRSRLLDAFARRLEERRPDFPVVAAGITGTVPAVARLLATIAGLGDGCVVLPGLDRAMDAASWRALEASPAHPQYGMYRLLERIGIERNAVAPWPTAIADRSPPARGRLLGEIMRPAATSEAWSGLEAAGADESATRGVTRVEHSGLAQEAAHLALRIREALETPGREVALVTSDRTLARRVAIELRRWDIAVDDSAGVPLDQTPPGSFLLLLAHAVIDGFPPVPLLSALKHPLASGGMAQAHFRRHVRAFERAALRGPRTTGGLQGLLALIRERGEAKHWPTPIEPAALAAWLERLGAAAAPLAELGEVEVASLPALIRAHLRLAEALAADADGDAGELWAKEAGEAASRFMTDLLAAAGDFPTITPSAYPAILAVLMAGEAVRPRRPSHPRVAILGQLEARLQSADLVLVGGLNEGVWPRPPEPSPWLNRPLRRALGLPPEDLQIGIAAHDFHNAASAPEVVLSRARKDGQGIPTTPSRWLARLDAVARLTRINARLDADAAWQGWTRQLLEPPGAPQPVPRPAPTPPLEARPRELWATDIELLVRDPYAFYAKRILGLGPLDALDQDPGFAERGTIIHRCLERFVRAYPEALPEQPYEKLIAIGRDCFAAFEHHPQVRAVWWPRFLQIAQWFVEEERKRRAELERVRVEADGLLELEAPGGRFRIRARADRVEIGRDGAFGLVDYKTGRAPAGSLVRAGIAPQLTLTAAIALAGGFGADTTEPILAEILYWSLKGGDPGGEISDPTLFKRKPVKSPAELAEEAKAGLARLIAHFDDPDSAYISVPRPEIAPTQSDYDHLARIAEWRGAEGEP